MSFKKIQTLLSIGVTLFLLSPTLTLAQFTDTQKDFLTYMYRHNILDGYPDDTFRPLESISRAELVKLALDTSHIQLIPDRDCFDDLLEGSWYKQYVCTAESLGIVEGYQNNKFGPSEEVTKAEALKIIAEAQDWELDTGQPPIINTGFKDMLETAWHFPYVNTARQYGYIDQVDYFYPDAPISREDVADILFRTMLEEKMGVEKAIGNNLDRLNRDFFRIENQALSRTFGEFSDYRQSAQDQQVVPRPQTMLADQQGNIYALMKFNPQGPQEGGWLESEVPSRANILLLAKFNPNEELLAVDWYNFFTNPTTSYEFRLKDVQPGDNLVVEIYETQTGNTTPTLWRTSTYKLNPLRIMQTPATSSVQSAESPTYYNRVAEYNCEQTGGVYNKRECICPPTEYEDERGYCVETSEPSLLHPASTDLEELKILKNTIVAFNCEQSGGTYSKFFCSCPIEQRETLEYDTKTGYCKTSFGTAGGELGESARKLLEYEMLKNEQNSRN